MASIEVEVGHLAGCLEDELLEAKCDSFCASVYNTFDSSSET